MPPVGVVAELTRMRVEVKRALLEAVADAMPDAQVAWGAPAAFAQERIIHGGDITGADEDRAARSSGPSRTDGFTVQLWILAAGSGTHLADRIAIDPTGEYSADLAAADLATEVRTVLFANRRLDLHDLGALGFDNIETRGPNAIVGPNGEMASAVEMLIDFSVRSVA